MKSGAYWKERFTQVEAASHASAVKTAAVVDDQYRTATKEIENQISSWYARFAKNNEISIAEARKLLTASELKELKWDVDTYIKYGKENAINEAWMKELENASAKYHISRLEALKMAI